MSLLALRDGKDRQVNNQTTLAIGQAASQAAKQTAVESFKLGQLELPVLAMSPAFGLVEGKPGKKTGQSAVTLCLKPLHNKAKTDLATAMGLKGADLKLKGRVYADQVAEWELSAMTKLIASGEWTAARRACRASANGKGITFGLVRVAAKVQPMERDDMLKALGLTEQQVAIAKSVKVTETVAIKS